MEANMADRIDKEVQEEQCSRLFSAIIWSLWVPWTKRKSIAWGSACMSMVHLKFLRQTDQLKCQVSLSSMQTAMTRGSATDERLRRSRGITLALLLAATSLTVPKVVWTSIWSWSMLSSTDSRFRWETCKVVQAASQLGLLSTDRRG